jgi:VWFA-related protein
VILLPLFAAVAISAQDEPAATQYTEEIEVRVIDVDVVVTDRRGNPITGLTREDFELYENGRRVDIDYFSRIAGGRIADMPAPDGELEEALQQRAALTWVIFIDHTNMTPQIRIQAMRQLQMFLQGAITRGDRGLIALNDGRSFRIRQGVTDDPKLLLRILAKMERERMSVSPTRSRANALLNHMRRSEADMGAGSGVRDETEFMAQTSGGEIDALIHEEAARTRAAILAMGALLDSLARMEGRLALVYVGAGFNTLPAADLAEVWRARYAELGKHPSEPRPEEEKLSIERELTRLYDNLSTLRVSVYTIHGGEQGGGPTSVEDSGIVNVNLPMETSTGIAALTEAGNARDIAERTGGLYFRVTPGLAGRLEAARRDFDDYYSVGYKPGGSPGDTRHIGVKVSVPGAHVRHRRTVRERTGEEKAAGAVVASMVQPVPRAVRKVAPAPIPTSVATAANPLGIFIEVNAPKGQFITFNFSFQLESLTFVKQGNVHRARFVMHFALVGRDGAVYPLESREQTLTAPVVSAADLVSTEEQYVSHAWHVDVSPLRVPMGVPARERGMQLYVTVEDRFSGTRSVVTVPLGR